MDLSLQAIDFLFASSIQDGRLLSVSDCSADGIVCDNEGDEDGVTFFRSHLSSCGLSGSLAGHDSKRKKYVVMLLHIEIMKSELCRESFFIDMRRHTCKLYPLSSLWVHVFNWGLGPDAGSGFT